MKNLKHTVTVVCLLAAASIPVFAGDVQTPPAPPPTPETATTATTSQVDVQNTDKAGGQGDLANVVVIVPGILTTMLSLL